MDNPEYTFQVLEVFSKIKPKEIPRELEEYISYVARTGDPVFQWSLVKVLIKEKLVAVLNEFKENNPSLEIPPCPNVDPFSYETLKSNLLTRLDSFILPPFTIQRICELLASPRKEYNRIDKYMRAVEKNILVVSACELSLKRGLDTDGNESMMNGMLYDKVNDSMNNFTNHVFSTSHDSNVDELHLSGKLDVPESDAVQQILDESWTSETGDGDDFKINEANSSSSISVSFENELQFVTDKSTLEKSDTDVDSETKPDERSTSSFDNDSLLMESSLQNIIVDNVSVSYDNTLKPTSEESPIEEPKIECKDNVIFNFNQSQPEDSTQGILPPVDEQPSTPSAEEKRSFDVSEPQSETSPADSELEPNLISAETESLTQTIDKDLPAGLEVENQYKSESTFEYENFPSEPTKSNSTLEYTFEPTSKPEFTDESSSTNDCVTLDHPEESTTEQQPIETTEKDQPEEQGKLDESLCSGDNEAQKSSTDLKESDPPAHGEPEATELSETNCDDKFENSLPLEETSE